MVLFSVVSLLILFSPNIVVFNALRLVQGLAGAGGLVLSKSIATDMYEGKQLADFLALMGAVNGIAPVCAPIIGGALSGITDWKGVPVGVLRVGS